MKNKGLFPYRYRLIGWLIFLPSAIVGLVNRYAAYEVSWLSLNSVEGRLGNMLGIVRNNLVDELAGIGVIIGLLFIAFSREKIEDEMIGQLRLEALQWSVYANYLILAVAMLTVYELAFLDVMVYNMFTVLLVFIGRFRWLIYRNNHRLAV